MRTNTDLVAAYAGPQVTEQETPAEASVEQPVETPKPVETPQPSAEELVAQARREERERAAREYQGLQRTLAKREAENAQLRAQAEQLRYLPGMAQVLNTLAQNQLGPEQARQLGAEVENAQLKAALQAAQERALAPQPQPEVAPVERPEPTKDDVLRAWFPSLKNIKADDPRIVWGEAGEDPARRQEKFRDSVLQAVTEDADKAAEAKAQQKVDAANARLRQSGVDESDPSLPSGAAGPRANIISLGQDPKAWKPREMMRSWFEENSGHDTRAARKAAVKTI